MQAFLYFMFKLIWSYGILLIYASALDVAVSWMCHWPWLDDRGNHFPRMNCSWTILYYQAGLWFLLKTSHASILLVCLFWSSKCISLLRNMLKSVLFPACCIPEEKLSWSLFLKEICMNINENYWILNFRKVHSTHRKCRRFNHRIGFFFFKSGQRVKVLSNQTQLILCLENCGRPYQPCDLSSWGKTYFWDQLASGCLTMGRISLWKLCPLLTKDKRTSQYYHCTFVILGSSWHHWSLNKKTQTKKTYSFSSLLLRMEPAFTHLYDFVLSCLFFSNIKERIPYISLLNFGMQVVQYYMQILHNIFTYSL